MDTNEDMHVVAGKRERCKSPPRTREETLNSAEPQTPKTVEQGGGGGPSLSSEIVYARITHDILLCRRTLLAGTNIQVLRPLCTDDDEELRSYLCKSLILNDDTYFDIPEEYLQMITEDELELCEAIVTQRYTPLFDEVW